MNPPETLGFALFDSALGFCGAAWGPHGLTGVQLPEADTAATRSRMRARFSQVPESAPPPGVQTAIECIVALLRGEPKEPQDLTHIKLDWRSVPPFNRRVLELARTIQPEYCSPRARARPI